MASFFVRALLIFGMLVTGSINTISKKIQNDCTSIGLDGQSEQFKKPWFQTIVMFSGEAVVLLAWGVGQCIQRNVKHSEARRKLADSSVNSLRLETKQTSHGFFRTALILLMPACCDLLGTTLAGIGLLYVYPSVWQMLRGSIIVFTSLLSVIFLKRKLYAYHWVSVGIIFIGLAAVGTASLFNETGKQSNMLLGLLLIIAGQFASATQMVVEELYVKKLNLLPTQVVGSEGCWGVIMMACVVLPVLYHVPGNDHGSYENALDALEMIKNNSLLLSMVLLYWCSIAFYNFCGLTVAKLLTSVHRTLIDALRTTVVWVVDLIIFYGFHEHEYGEKWGQWSPLQLGGFVMLMLGTFCYNEVVRIPGLYYPPKEDDSKVVKRLSREAHHAGERDRLLTVPEEEEINPDAP